MSSIDLRRNRQAIARDRTKYNSADVRAFVVKYAGYKAIDLGLPLIRPPDDVIIVGFFEQPTPYKSLVITNYAAQYENSNISICEPEQESRTSLPNFYVIRSNVRRSGNYNCIENIIIVEYNKAEIEELIKKLEL